MKPLRKGELAIMEIFWASDKPLSSLEIKEVGVEGYNTSSVSNIIGKMVRTGYLEVVEQRMKRNIAYRTYRPIISEEDYYSEIVAQAVRHNSSALLGALPKLKDENAVPDDILTKLKEIINGWKD